VSRVLIVEDEVHLAQGLRFNLEAEGLEVEVVGDGESALNLLLGRKQQFDAVVLDVMLPGKDGFSVAAELRAAENYVPVLMLTARREVHSSARLSWAMSEVIRPKAPWTEAEYGITIRGTPSSSA